MPLLRVVFFGCGLILFGVLERFHPYRPVSVQRHRRWMTNLALAACNTALLSVFFVGITAQMAEKVTSHNLGLVPSLVRASFLPFWGQMLASILLLDFALYIWHLLNHEVPLFWRFHRVHHSDLNMDVSTATRFHIGELIMSGLIKIGLIYSIGVTPLAIFVFDTLVVLCAQFHHSSFKISAAIEGPLRILFVPPSMHRIHHSVVIRERNTNYGTIFSVWDRLLGTLLTDVAQDKIIIGVGAYQAEQLLGFGGLLAMPFWQQVP